MAKQRNYKKEYQRDHASPKAKKDRAARNKARRQAIAEGRVSKGTAENRSTREIDHKKPLSKGGSNAKSNQRVVSRSTNRRKATKSK